MRKFHFSHVEKSVKKKEILMNLTPEELKARLNRGEKLVLLDIREPEECAICQIDGSTWIPMRELPTRINELNPKDSVVVYCHSGGRSTQVVRWLLNQGFRQAENLDGGIDAWAELIDPTMERY